MILKRARALGSSLVPTKGQRGEGDGDRSKSSSETISMSRRPRDEVPATKTKRRDDVIKYSLVSESGGKRPGGKN